LKYDSDNASYYRELFDQLAANAGTDHEKIEAINRFVATKYNPKETRWSFSSARLILEGGAPHCSNLAFAMAAITASGGYPTRTVHTSDTAEYRNTHVVVEVYYDDGWHIYDPTYGVCFLDKNGAVASYKDLRLLPELITQKAFQGLKPNAVETILHWMPKTYSSGFHQIYVASEDDFHLSCR
jgi:hypothetical protein